MMSVAISEAEQETAVEWPPLPTRAAVAWRDLADGFGKSWMWVALALQDIKLRYRGSVLGPLWLTISTLVMVVAIGVIATPDAVGTRLDVAYVFAHQDGNPEADTLIRVYRHSGVGTRCLVAEQHGPEPVLVPPDLTGTFEVSVQPGTATKRGSEYFSDDVVVGSDAAGGAACPSS